MRRLSFPRVPATAGEEAEGQGSQRVKTRRLLAVAAGRGAHNTWGAWRACTISRIRLPTRNDIIKLVGGWVEQVAVAVVACGGHKQLACGAQRRDRVLGGVRPATAAVGGADNFD